MTKSYRFLATFLLCSLACVTAGFAQSPQTGSNANGDNLAAGEKRVTLTQTVEPSFHIEPIVHRFEGRRGEVIPFQFLIKSTGKSMDVTVMPVKLRQETSGIILHDTESEPADEITFTSKTEFQLTAGESFLIEGYVTIPLAKSNFLSFGVLVRDNGQLSADTKASSDPTATSAAIRFVTQYVLRIDIETGEKDLSEMNRLEFELGRIRTVDGLPVAETYLVNPTDFAFECNVRGEIKTAAKSRSKPFRMGLPSRVNLLGEDKYLVRIMPNSRVRVGADIEDMLFPGKQTLRLSISNGRRSLSEKDFSINISGGSFPALESKLAYISDSLSVTPAQIRMGQIASANRTSTLKFMNSSDASQTVKLAMVSLDGQPLEGVRLTSSDFELRAGRSKSVRATILRDGGSDQPVYGRIRVSVFQEDEIRSEQTLPLALLYATPPAPQIEFAELESIENAGLTSFRLSVTNQGEGFVPVHAELQIADTRGHVINLSDGYGRWLDPGESRELRFTPEQTLAAGDYQLTLKCQTTADQPSTTKTLVITLNPDTEDPRPTQTGEVKPDAVTATDSANSTKAG